ncbi:hypothetical protein HDV04_005828 [Boothiomyces sp. JEL0838]|nr:hypothetical protein HDV04_005828 [Boothiomyces sp. JEL0838]
MISGQQNKQEEKELLLVFIDLQGQRTMTFNDFDKGFDLFINKEATEQEYIQLVDICTKTFSSISYQIKEILKMHQFELIKQIQQLEKTKLEKVVKYQSLMTETVYGQVDYSQDISNVKKELEELKTEINEKIQDLHCILADEYSD